MNALQFDFSAGTTAFRENLLQKCLVEIEASNDVLELDDDSLDMLAAAGVPDPSYPLGTDDTDM